MNQFLEAAAIALNAIWSNKLRSLLTVLGNIVAVTSIIAVVSLIQGMNGYVTNAIVSDVGADSFTIQRQPAIRTQEDEDRVRNNPRITLDDASAVRDVQREHHGRGGAGATPARRSATASETLDSVQVRGVSREYISSSRPTRPSAAASSARSRSIATARGLLGCDDRGAAVRPARSDRQGRSGSAGVHFRVVGVSEKKGSIFGQSQDEFALIPLGSVPEDVRLACRTSRCSSSRRSPELVQRGHGRRDRGAAHRAAAASRRSRTTSGCSPRTRCSTSTGRPPPASSRCSSASSPCRSSSAAS